MYEPRVTVVHKSLLEAQLIGGVEKSMAIMNGTIALAFCLGLNNLYYLPFAFILHYLMVWGYRKDPEFRAIYLRYTVLGEIYDPWPHLKMKTNARPKGFGQGMLC